MRLSVVIPALNEADSIGSLLQGLQGLRAAGHEVIVVDGGSDDATVEMAQALVDRLVISTAGRALQMNNGARVASGEVLWFLHADSRVPASAAGRILDTVDGGGGWGRFDVHLSGKHFLLRIVERMMNLRSRVTGIATGDQGIFVTRELFERVGAYREQPLMEDIDISTRLKRIQRPVCLRDTLTTSSRRWERNGIVRTVLLMSWLRLAYFLGVSASRLAMRYE